MFQIPRGTRDFTSEAMQKRRYVEIRIASTFQAFGYQEIQTPMFETLELFTAKSGDAIIDELYAFSDKSGRKLALRPELTAPVIRFYVEQLQMEPKPLKLFYFGNCFRYDRPQKGRYREFQQAGCEIIGVNTPEAYAELIALAYQILKNIGLKKITLRIGNLTIVNAMFTILGISESKKKSLLPLIDKSQYDEVSDYLSNIGISRGKIEEFLTILQTSDIIKIREYVKNETNVVNEITFMNDVLDLLKNSFKVKEFLLDMSIVRGLDYYKGLVFELEAPVLGAEKQLCGGGAYDLVQLFGGTDTPTAGFAIGFDRTILALEAENFSFPSFSSDAYVIPVNEDMIGKAIDIAQSLRNEEIMTDIDISRRGLGKALKYANGKNIKHVIIVGPKELDDNSVTLRDMKTGDQQKIKITALIATLKNS